MVAANSKITTVPVTYRISDAIEGVYTAVCHQETNDSTETTKFLSAKATAVGILNPMRIADKFYINWIWEFKNAYIAQGSSPWTGKSP